MRQVILFSFTGDYEFVRWQLLWEILHAINPHVLINLLIVYLCN